MHRFALLLASPVFISCASLTANDVTVGDTPAYRPAAAPETATEVDTITLAAADLDPVSVESASTVSEAPSPSLFGAAAQEGESLHGNRFTIKAGIYSADADEIDDDGWIVNASWLRFMSKLFALEFELGYVDVGGDDADVWALPIMVNGRANIPIWKLDVYGGLGVGTFYYDIDAGSDDDGFLLGGNAFLGATINVADRIALGLEGKYYVTEDADDFDESLDAFALMLTLGFSR